MPRRLLHGLLIALALGAFLSLVYLGLTWDLRQDASRESAGFRTETVARGGLDEKVVATGTLEPFARVVVQSEIPGVVARVLVDEGQRVERDQPLVELQRERLEDRAAQLRAQLAEREARARFDLVGRAQAELDKARRNQSRAERLRREDILSEERLEDLRHAVRLAEIGLTDATAERAARLAAADQARNALRRAERDLEQTVIRSPVNGVLVSRPVEVGTAVADIQNGGTVVAELADDRRIHMTAEVDENEVARVRVGQAAAVRIDAFPGEDFEGRVRRVSASGESDGSMSSFEVEIEIDPDPRVRVGMSADARIAVAHHADALLVPNAAILRTDTGPRVRRAQDGDRGAFELVEIREVYSDGFQTVVVNGVAEGDVLLVRAER
jgi:HlyD family secretion protein